MVMNTTTKCTPVDPAGPPSPCLPCNAPSQTHTTCRRCNNKSFHIQKSTCASCGYPAAKKRTFQWGKKEIRRKTTGTGRMQYMKTLPRRFKVCVCVHSLRPQTNVTAARRKNANNLRCLLSAVRQSLARAFLRLPSPQNGFQEGTQAKKRVEAPAA